MEFKNVLNIKNRQMYQHDKYADITIVMLLNSIVNKWNCIINTNTPTNNKFPYAFETADEALKHGFIWFDTVRDTVFKYKEVHQIEVDLLNKIIEENDEGEYDAFSDLIQGLLKIEGTRELIEHYLSDKG